MVRTRQQNKPVACAYLRATDIVFNKTQPESKHCRAARDMAGEASSPKRHSAMLLH